MGHDFGNYQIFCGNTSPKEVHDGLLSELPKVLAALGYQAVPEQAKADRHIVVCPPNRWIGIYDSFLAGDNPSDVRIEQLATALSLYKPVINISLYDSWILHLFVYRNGRKVDRFVNSADFYVRMMKDWEPLEVHNESDFHGQLEQWQEFLINASDLDALRLAWQRKSPVGSLLDEMAQLVGWDMAIVQGGYVLSNDAGPFWDYKGYLASEGVDTSSLDVFSFNAV